MIFPKHLADTVSRRSYHIFYTERITTMMEHRLWPGELRDERGERSENGTGTGTRIVTRAFNLFESIR